jgi:hypothetical protein
MILEARNVTSLGCGVASTSLAPDLRHDPFDFRLAAGGWVPGALVLDGSTVYWTIAAGNWPAPGAIMRANVDGTDAVILACDPNTPGGIAVDATSVYWTSSGTDGGAVYRLTPK